MDNALFQFIGIAVFLSVGNCMSAKEKPPDGFQNDTESANTSVRTYNSSAEPLMLGYTEKTATENRTLRQHDTNSPENSTEGPSNFSAIEKLSEVNGNIFTNHSLTGANSSVITESGVSSTDKLEDYDAETDWGKITLTEVNTTLTPNSTAIPNSSYRDAKSQPEEEKTDTESNSRQNKTPIPEYQKNSNSSSHVDSVDNGINRDVNNASNNMSTLFHALTSTDQAKNFSDGFSQPRPNNSTLPLLGVGYSVSSNPVNTSDYDTDNASSEKHSNFSHDYVYNSTGTEKADNLPRRGCGNSSEGLTSVNCTSSPPDQNSSVMSVEVTNKTAEIGSNMSNLPQNHSGPPQFVTLTSGLIPDQGEFNYSNLSPTVMKSNRTITRTNSPAGPETGSNATPTGSAGHQATLSPHLKQHYKGVMQTILLEGLKRGAWEPKVPIEDGPFGSLIWRDKKYLISVLVPIGVGITGAVVIVVVAYAVRSYKRKQKRRAFASPSRTFRPQAQLAIMDQVLLLDDSSDDEF